MKILEEREKRLTVRAPITGVVPTFQIEQLLLNRPVRRGEKLLEVMDETGPWRLELEVEEYRVGHILRAQRELGTNELDVEYVLATNVEVPLHGKLQRLSTRANASEKTGSVVLAYVRIDPTELPMLRIGAEVRAKIACGKRSLGYVFFGDVVEFFQKQAFTWF
ncbi:MAG TPA: HlyD family secretion protein [Planctomycetaceae bacterium]|nr:HlyD family secretion protein [Planctomycetaceae bacterium]